MAWFNAAIWFSDLRNFTHLTETLPADQLLELLNSYFEFVSAAVTARGGEILRFDATTLRPAYLVTQSGKLSPEFTRNTIR